MEPKKSFRLKQPTPEEVNAFNADLKTIIEKHGVELRAVPTFSLESSTGKYLADAQVVVFKKVEQVIVEKDAGQPTTEPGPSPEPGPEAAPVQEEEKAPQEANS